MGSGLPGQVVVPYPPVCPPVATAVNIYADTPLELSNTNSPHNTEHVIPNGKVLRLQRIIMGAGKDPSEKGSMIELIYNNGTEHVVARFFVDQKTNEVQLADVGEARDGTPIIGNGSTYKFVIRRTRLSSSAQPVDIHVQGYEE